MAAEWHQGNDVPTSGDGDQSAITFDQHITFCRNLLWTTVIHGTSSLDIEIITILIPDAVSCKWPTTWGWPTTWSPIVELTWFQSDRLAFLFRQFWWREWTEYQGGRISNPWNATYMIISCFWELPPNLYVFSRKTVPKTTVMACCTRILTYNCWWTYGSANTRVHVPSKLPEMTPGHLN